MLKRETILELKEVADDIADDLPKDVLSALEKVPLELTNSSSMGLEEEKEVS